MGNIQSNEKSRLQDDKKNFQNKSLKSQIKTAIKKAKADKSRSSANEAVKLINAAVARGVFHENKGARLVSKIQSIDVFDVIMKKPGVGIIEEKVIVVNRTAKGEEESAAKAKSTTGAKKPATKAKSTTAKKPAAKTTTKKPAAKPKSTTATKKPAAKTTTKKPVAKK